MSLFWFLAIAVICHSPVGRAIADMIAGRGGGAIDPAELEAAEHRLEDHLLELEERLEFAERLLQQQRARDQLPPV